MMNTIKIYTLEHPITNEVRYIGYTKTKLSERLTKHIRDARSRNSNHRVNWINSIVKLGLKPIVKEIDSGYYEDRIWLECMYISLFKQWGFRLVNGTEGGDGGDTWGKLSPTKLLEAKNKLSNTLKGRVNGPLSEEHRKSLSDNHWSKKEGYVHPCKGRVTSDETKEKQRKAKLGIQFNRGSIYGPVNKICKISGIILGTYINPLEAAEDSVPNTNRNNRSGKASNIANVAKGKHKQAYGYKWEFVN